MDVACLALLIFAGGVSGLHSEDSGIIFGIFTMVAGALPLSLYPFSLSSQWKSALRMSIYLVLSLLAFASFFAVFNWIPLAVMGWFLGLSPISSWQLSDADYWRQLAIEK